MARLVADDRLASLAQTGSCQNRGIHKAICEHEAPDKSLSNPLLSGDLSMYLLHFI